MTFETRMGATPFEFREDGDTLTLQGYASTFNQPYDMGWYDETVAPGAFARTLGRKPDVRLLINHDDLPLARTASGTLELSEDTQGLLVRATLDRSDPDVARIAPKLRRGDLNQMSFGFRIDSSEGQEWGDVEGRRKRTLRSLNLHDGDVSVVTFPANPTTTVGLRSTTPFGLEPVVAALLDLERRNAPRDQVQDFLSGVLDHFRAAGIDPAAAVDLLEAPAETESVDNSPESDERAAALLATERRVASIRALIAR